MNTYQYISLPEIRDRVKIQLGILNDTSSDDFIDLKIVNAARSLISQQNLIYKTEVLEIIDFKAELPCDFYRLIAMVTNPMSGQPLIYSDYNFISSPNYKTIPYGTRFMVQDGMIMFPSNYDNDEITIIYQAFLQDENGFPKYYLTHADYLTYTACYWLTLQNKDAVYKEYKMQMIKHKKTIYNNEAVDKFRLDVNNIKNIIQRVVPERWSSLYVWNNNLVIT